MKLNPVFLILLLTIASRSSTAATLRVPEDFPTISAAIAAAEGADEILVGPGEYHELLDLSNRPLQLRAAFGPATTILDGQGAGPIVTWSNAPPRSLLEGFTIRNGRGPDGADGGALPGVLSGLDGGPGALRVSGNLLVRDCIFLNNIGGEGGDGANASASPGAPAGNGGLGGPGVATVSNSVGFLWCTFSGNRGGAGGRAGRGLPGVSGAGQAGVGGPGVLLLNTIAPMDVHLCRFSQNLGGVGGRGANASVLANMVTSPSLGGRGGPGALLALGGSPLTLASCLLDQNRGGRGGNGGDGLILPNSGVVPGVVGGVGGSGAITALSIAVTLGNCTSAANAAEAGGANGAFYTGEVAARGPGLASGGPVLTVRNNILWSNSTPVFSTPSSISYSGMNGGAAGAGNVNLTASPFAYGYRLSIFAPCIDSASSIDLSFDRLDCDSDLNSFELLPQDLGRALRVIDAPGIANTGSGPPPPVDMGAYEYFGFAPAPGDMNCDGRVDNFDIDPFVLALTQPVVYEHLHRNCALAAGDVDLDGQLTNFDIDPFVSMLVE